jgi:O-succinylbenzoate synthase
MRCLWFTDFSSKFVLDITDDTMEESLAAVMFSNWIESSLGIAQLSRAIMTAVNIRPFRILAFDHFLRSYQAK